MLLRRVGCSDADSTLGLFFVRFAKMERPRDTETYRWAMAPGLTTPNASFYIRNHCPVPASAGADHTIDFRSAVNRDQQENTLTLAEMQKRFEQVDVTSVMQCCGNRAAEMIARNKPTSFTGTPCVVSGWLRDVVHVVGECPHRRPRVWLCVARVHRCCFTSWSPSPHQAVLWGVAGMNTLTWG